MKPLSLLPAIALLLLLPLSCKAEDQQDPGLHVFMQNGCFACHGQMGGGGFGPALAGDRMLVLPKFVVAQILIGRGKMPEFGSRLSNEDIAAVAQYVRNSWGNHYGPVSAGDVASVRDLMKKASDAAAKAQTPEIH